MATIRSEIQTYYGIYCFQVGEKRRIIRFRLDSNFNLRELEGAEVIDCPEIVDDDELRNGDLAFYTKPRRCSAIYERRISSSKNGQGELFFGEEPRIIFSTTNSVWWEKDLVMLLETGVDTK